MRVGFGNKQSFFIDIDNVTHISETMFGTANFFVCGFPIGDSYVAPLGPLYTFLKAHISDMRVTSVVDIKEECSVLFHVIEDQYFGFDLSDEYEPDLDKLILCPGGGESFDGWQVFVIDDEERRRFVFKDSYGPEGMIRCCYVNKKDFIVACESFILWMDSHD